MLHRVAISIAWSPCPKNKMLVRRTIAQMLLGRRYKQEPSPKKKQGRAKGSRGPLGRWFLPFVFFIAKGEQG